MESEFRKNTILIVEDEVIIAEDLMLRLNRLGYEVLPFASTGRKALETLSNTVTDLVLMDIHMPKMNGLEALKRTRQKHVFDNTIFIAMSATLHHKKDCIDAGFVGFLEKPLKYEKLYDLLCRYLNLEWIYENKPEIKQETYDLPLISPPEKELLALLELEKVGNIIEIENMLNKIEKNNNKYIPFVKKIRQFTESYKIDSFIEYINSFLDKGTE